jgi:hypothetical protein
MKTTLQQLAQNSGSTRGYAAKTSTMTIAVLSTLLAACSVVPGQHMETPPSIPVSSSPDGTVQQAEQIPIQAIDLNLIRQLNGGAGQMELAKELKTRSQATRRKVSWSTATAISRSPISRIRFTQPGKRSNRFSVKSTRI